ncbi:hypothetical protein O181_008333 [Austropuccinia psidii MF-1]|uniref:Uncharacterized protein n=1 Tax=Austropuccinia psidii MF-1 TaxID=1389203 RepID=A0A9Q3BNX2_9BASI|nr:hypothetical protein [Austropuccinia psidii MF-1]
MEDATASISSQRLARNFDTLIQSPEAYITAIPFVRSEKFPTSRSRDIPVSVQELVYGSKAAGILGPEKTQELLKGWTPIYCKGQVEKPKDFVRGSEERVGPKKGKQPCGSSPSLQVQEYTSKSAEKRKASPKEQPEGQEKGKGKGKTQMEQALPSELHNSKEGKNSHEQCFQYGKNFDGTQNKGGGKNET